jgi:Domain of unknown function (DUF3883)
MNYQEANILAKKWFETLKLPDNLEGKQINLLNYITDPIDTPLYRQKKKILGIEFRKKGAKSIIEHENWTYSETELICEFYITELKSYIVFQNNKVLGEATKILKIELGKPTKSIKLKLQHISSILVNSDLPYLEDYKPIPRAEIDITDWTETYNLKKILLERFNRTDLTKLLLDLSTKDTFNLKLPITLELDEIPDENIYDEIGVSEQKSFKIRPKINYVEREIKNSKLGEAGEEWVLNFEKQRLSSIGLERLIEKISWVSKEIGDGLGYDIISYNSNSEQIYIEVKTTCLGKSSAFYLTQREIEVANCTINYYIYRVFDFDRGAKIYILENNLAEHLDLVPINYRATVKKTTHNIVFMKKGADGSN